MAERLFASKNFFDAITEYKRFLFFNKESTNSWYVKYKIGQAYRNLKDWDRALYYMRAAEVASPDEKSRVTVEIGLAVILMAQKNYAGAEFQLLRLASFTGTEETRGIVALYQGVLSILTFKWHEAEKALRIYFESNPGINSVNDKQMILALLEEGKSLNLKSPKTARILSLFFPGAGQLYAGKPLLALNALIINGLSLALFGFTIITANYPEAVLSFLYLINKYYPGNIYQAGRIVEERNLNIEEHLSNRVLDILKEYR
ncbi:MAG: tetratricopeptide repeat protein [Spirochaetota bacterium]